MLSALDVPICLLLLLLLAFASPLNGLLPRTYYPELSTEIRSYQSILATSKVRIRFQPLSSFLSYIFYAYRLFIIFKMKFFSRCWNFYFRKSWRYNFIVSLLATIALLFLELLKPSSLLFFRTSLEFSSFLMDSSIRYIYVTFPSLISLSTLL